MTDLLSQMLFFELCDDECETEERCDWECQECGENLLVSENYRVCPRCGLCSDKEIDCFVNPFLMRKRSVYKRIAHFKSVLSAIQNQEFKGVPQSVVEEIKKHLETCGNPEDVRRVLKEMGQSKYYKNSVQIWCKLHNVTTFKCLTPDETEQAVRLFKKVQEVYDIVKREFKRKNFINYNFLTYRILILINRPDVAFFCKSLRNSALRSHNRMWRRMGELCPELLKV